MPDITIIEAPLVSEMHPSGVDQMPEALREAGLYQRLNAQEGPKLPKPDWTPLRDEATRILNPVEVWDYSKRLAAAVEDAIKQGSFPLVLGGGCAVLLGCLLAHKRTGPQEVTKSWGGLFFVDGHTDLIPPEKSPTGEVSDMELGLALGRGPEILSNLDDQGPLLHQKDVVLFGYRDQATYGSLGLTDPREEGLFGRSLGDIRNYGFGNALGQSLEYLERRTGRSWLHLDLDVLDDATLPAVDYRMADGLSMGEVVAAVRRLVATGKVSGMNVTIFNPTLDWDGSQARMLVDALGVALKP